MISARYRQRALNSYSMIVDASNGSIVAGQRTWLPKGVVRR